MIFQALSVCYYYI